MKKIIFGALLLMMILMMIALPGGAQPFDPSRTPMVEREPGEARAEYLFNLGIGEPWIWSERHPEEYGLEPDRDVNLPGGSGYYYYPTECYMIAVSEESAYQPESWSATVRYTDPRGRSRTEIFSPGEVVRAYTQGGAYLEGTTKIITAAPGTPVTASVANSGLHQPMTLAIYRTDCRNPWVSSTLLFRGDSWQGSRIEGTVGG